MDTGREIDRQTGRQAEREIDRETGREIDRQTDRQIDRRSERERNSINVDVMIKYTNMDEIVIRYFFLFT